MTDKQYVELMNKYQMELLNYIDEHPTTEVRQVIPSRKSNFNGLKKVAVGFMTALALTVAIPASANAKESNYPVLTEANSKMVNGYINKMEVYPCGCTFVEVTVTSKGKWNGHRYASIYSRRDMKNWKEEQGKIHLKEKVEVLLWDKETKNVYDDEIVNIHKAR